MRAENHTKRRSRERAIDPRPVVVLVLIITMWAVLSDHAVAGTVSLTTEEMTAHSQSVLIADVIGSRASQTSAGDINTAITLRAVRNLKGAPRPVTFTLTVPGGTVGARTDWVSDSPSFTVGERVLLFLDEKDRIVSGPGGRLEIVDDFVPQKGKSLASIEAQVAGRDVAASRRALPEEFGLLADGPTSDSDTGTGSLVTASAPSISAISPAAAPAGTGDTITIAGSGFGSTPGVVEFFYRSGRPSVLASGSQIKQWSDTRIVTEVPVGLVEGYSAAAASGPVNVVTAAGSRSAGYGFSVTFAYGSASWSDPTQDYYVNPNTPDTTGELAMVQAAASTWSAVGSFSLEYAGATSSTSIDSSLGNGKNEIFWSDLPDGYLGQARYRMLSGSILEADIALNDEVYVGSNQYPWGSGTSGTFDVQSTTLHELGHWLNLRDQYGATDADEVMYGTGMVGTRQRVLHDNDRNGILWIYDLDSLDGPAVSRLAGTTRYSTALAVSASTFSDGSAKTAVLATGAGFADALAASGLAGCYNAPLLLTTRNAVVSGLPEELERLGTTEVIVVGGPSAIEDSVLSTLGKMGYDVTRVGGSDRYDTAAKVAQRIAECEGAAFSGEAFLARGDSFADALAAAPYAYNRRMPVLLTRPGSLPDTTLRTAAAIGIDHVYVAGGDGAVSPGVVSSMGRPHTRAAGSNRYATAAALASLAIDKDWITPSVAGVTTGQNYPDALSGGAAIGAQGGIVLLTPGTSLCSPAGESLDECSAILTEIQVFGGEGAVSPQVVRDIRLLWR